MRVRREVFDVLWSREMAGVTRLVLYDWEALKMLEMIEHRGK
jgi:hypothetical protein